MKYEVSVYATFGNYSDALKFVDECNNVSSFSITGFNNNEAPVITPAVEEPVDEPVEEPVAQAAPETHPADVLMGMLNDERYTMRTVNSLEEKTGWSYDKIRAYLNDEGFYFSEYPRRSDGSLMIGLDSRN